MKISKVIFHIKLIPSHPWWERKKSMLSFLNYTQWVNLVLRHIYPFPPNINYFQPPANLFSYYCSAQSMLSGAHLCVTSHWTTLRFFFVFFIFFLWLQFAQSSFLLTFQPVTFNNRLSEIKTGGIYCNARALYP